MPYELVERIALELVSRSSSGARVPLAKVFAPGRDGMEIRLAQRVCSGQSGDWPEPDLAMV